MRLGFRFLTIQLCIFANCTFVFTDVKRVGSPLLSKRHKHQRFDCRLGLVGAIAQAGLEAKATRNGHPSLSPLDSSEKIRVLRLLGDPAPDSPFTALFNLACDFRKPGYKIPDSITSSSPFPIIDNQSLYVRESYKALYDIIRTALSNRPKICVIGTSGIGKSTFLLYFVLRLLGQGTGDGPIVILQSYQVFMPLQVRLNYVSGILEISNHSSPYPIPGILQTAQTTRKSSAFMLSHSTVCHQTSTIKRVRHTTILRKKVFLPYTWHLGV